MGLLGAIAGPDIPSDIAVYEPASRRDADAYSRVRREITAARGDVEAVIQRLRSGGSKRGSLEDVLDAFPDAHVAVNLYEGASAFPCASA